MNGDAWFASWSCNCTDIERSPHEIPDRCPTHDAELLADDASRRRVKLTHSGVSGYGIRDENGGRP